MAKAYSYVRMSRPEQIRGDSLRRQLQMSRDYAAEHGLELDESLLLHDIGVSGFKGKHRSHGALGAFLEKVETGVVVPGSYLLVENLDRLSREQISTALRGFLNLLDAGIKIVTLADKQEYSSGFDLSQIIISIVSMGKAHQESADKSKRLAAAWSEKRRRAGAEKPTIMTSRVPAWLKADRKAGRFFVLQDRALIVKRIFSAAIDGLGAMTITRQLNRDRIDPFGRSDAWHMSTVKKILSSEAVFGRFQPHSFQEGRRRPTGVPIDAYYPVVVDEVTYWKARAAIEARRRTGKGRKGKGIKNLLAGLAKCAVCGKSMATLDKGPPPKGGVYLQCSGARLEAGCPNKHLFRIDQVEQGILTALATTDLSHRFNAIASEQKDIAAEIEVVDSRLSKAEFNLKRMVALFESEDDTDLSDALGERIKHVRSEAKRLKEERRQLRKRLKTGEVVSAQDAVDSMLKYLSHIASLPDADERFLERSKMAQELRRLVARIVFYGNAVNAIFHDDSEEGLVELDQPDRLAGVPYLEFEPEGSLPAWRLVVAS